MTAVQQGSMLSKGDGTSVCHMSYKHTGTGLTQKTLMYKWATKQTDTVRGTWMGICVCPKITRSSTHQSQAQLQSSPTQIAGYHPIQPRSTTGNELHVLSSFVYPQKVSLSLLIRCYDLSASKYQRLCIMVPNQPPWLKGMLPTRRINDLFMYEDLDGR